MPRLEAFEEDHACVLEKLREGFVDHIEVISQVVESEFFRKLLGDGDLQKLASTYPSPRKKEEVPLWLYLSSQMTLRLHGAGGYSSLPYILHCGGLRDALEPGQVERKQKDTGESCLQFQGYNDKADYPRSTPCDQDFVRKLARDTKPHSLQAWLATDVARFYRERKAYDAEGIFIIDGSYLFVPDNESYEGSRVAFFDEHNHPISKEEEQKLTPAEQKRCRFRRYYQNVSLCHTNREADFLLYAGTKVLKEGGEVGQLMPLVDDFHQSVGPGVMKTLLIDRGFITGKSIAAIKENYGVDVIVPLKANMDITQDAWKLAEVDPSPWQVWQPPRKQPPQDPPQRPEHIRKREKSRQRTVRQHKENEGLKPRPTLVRMELKVIASMKLWKDCSVPLDVVLLREHMSDGKVNSWGLMTTRRVQDPVEIRELYSLRGTCEEGWRQTKCYWDLTGFRSTSFSLVVNHVVFVLLTYSLLQIFLIETKRGDIAKKTRERLLQALIPDGEKVAVYWENRVGYFGVREYSEILLTLAEGARRRLLGKIQSLRKSELELPSLPFRST